jgi:hypothetical protein
MVVDEEIKSGKGNDTDEYLSRGNIFGKFLHIRQHQEVGNINSRQVVQLKEITKGAKIRREPQKATKGFRFMILAPLGLR